MNTNMTLTKISIKGIDKKTYKVFKVKCKKEGLKVGQALTLAMQQWLNSEKRKPRLSFLNFKPTKGKRGTERLSEEIDKVLYEE